MQRVALGRALVRDPRAFLMDEPLTNLDLKLRVEMRTELTRIHRSLGRTFLYVTNDQVEAMSMADRVAVLRAGTVQQVGSPTEIYDRPANRWVATFVGSPRMNLLAVHRQRAAGGDRAGRCRIPGSRSKAIVRRCSACAPRICRWTCATSQRRSTARSTRSSRWATARSSTSRSATSGSSSRRRRRRRCEIGEQIRAAVDLDRVHLFDAGTESADRATMIDVPLTPVLRRARILERVQRDGGASLADLASEHAVSPVTVHRDLELLSDAGPARARARGRPLAAGHPAADRGRRGTRACAGPRARRTRSRSRHARWSRTARRSSSTRRRPVWRWRARWSCARRPS